MNVIILLSVNKIKGYFRLVKILLSVIKILTSSYFFITFVYQNSYFSQKNHVYFIILKLTLSLVYQSFHQPYNILTVINSI